MYKLFLILFITLNLFPNAQVKKSNFIGTSYQTVVETICEETSEPDACAGRSTILILNFKKDFVEITEKQTNTCSVIIYKNEYKSKWLLSKNKIIIRDLKFKNLLFIENGLLLISKNSLVGKNRNWQDSYDEYVFTKRF